MPDRDGDEQQSARLLIGLIWAGVGLAPVAVLVALLGGGANSLRFALLLLAVCIVLIGASMLIRNDPVLLRVDVQDRLAEEAQALRDELHAEIAAAVQAAAVPRPMTPPPMPAPPMAALPIAAPPMAAAPMAGPQSGARPAAAAAAVPAGTAQVPRPAQPPRPAAATAQVPRPGPVSGAAAQVPRPGPVSGAVPAQRTAGAARPARPQGNRPPVGRPALGAGPPVAQAGAGQPVAPQPASPAPARRGAAGTSAARAAVRPPDGPPSVGAPGRTPVGEPDEEPVVRSRRGRRGAGRAAAKDDHLDASPSAWLAAPDNGWMEHDYDEPAWQQPADDGHGLEPDEMYAVAYGAAQPDHYRPEPDYYGTGESDAYEQVDQYGQDPRPPSRGRHGPPAPGYAQEDEHGRW